MARTKLFSLLLLLFALAFTSLPASAQFSGQQEYVVGAGSANAQTASFPNANSLSDLLGVSLRIKAGATNTTAMTLTVNSFSPQNVIKPTPAGPAALGGGEVINTQIFEVVWDGTNFQLISSVNSAAIPQSCQFNTLRIVSDSGTPNSIMDISAASGILINPTNNAGFFFGSITANVNITTGTGTSTAGGMDGSSPTANGFLKLYVIYNGSTIAGLASNASNATPTLPSGYTFYCYAGSAKVNASGNFYGFRQNGDEARYVVGGNLLTGLPVIVNGVTGSTCAGSSPTYASEVVAGNSGAAPLWFPPTAVAIDVLANGFFTSADSANVLVAPNTSYGAMPASAANTNPPPVFFYNPASGVAAPFGRILLESSSIAVCISTISGAVHAYGWKDGGVSAN